MTTPAVIAIDQGTTGSKAYRLDADGRFSSLGGFEHRQIYPQPGWVEHDARELLDHLRQLVERGGDAAALGIDNQGETVVAWDGDSGEPLGNAIVWQDARTLPLIEKLKAEGAETLTIERAGLPLDPYFSASEAEMDHRRAARGQAPARAGPAALRHQRQLLPRSPRGNLCDRRHHRLAHQPDESRTPAMGSRALPPLRRSHRDACRRSAPQPAISAASKACPCAPAWSTSRPPSSAMAAASPARRRSPSVPAPSRSASRPATLAPAEAAGMNRSIAWTPQRWSRWSMRIGGRRLQRRLGSQLGPRPRSLQRVRGDRSLRRPLGPGARPGLRAGALGPLGPLLGPQCRWALARHGAGDDRADMMQAVLEGVALLAAEVIAAMDRACAPLGAALDRRRALQQRLFLRFPGAGAAAPGAGAFQRRSHRPRHGPDGDDRRRSGHPADPAVRPRPPAPCHTCCLAGFRRPRPLHRGRRPCPQLAVTVVPC